MRSRLLLVVALGLLGAGEATASCKDVSPDAQPGPHPSYRGWSWPGACYIDWPGGGGSQRSEYERRCRGIDGFIAFDGDYGSNHNLCIFKPAPASRAQTSPSSSEPTPNTPESIANRRAEWWQSRLDVMQAANVAAAEAMQRNDFRSATQHNKKYTAAGGELSAAVDRNEFEYIVRHASPGIVRNKNEQWNYIGASNRCLSVVMFLWEHLSIQAMKQQFIDSEIKGYHIECIDKNHLGLNPLFHRLSALAQNSNARGQSTDVAKPSSQSLGVMSGENCRRLGGVPASTITSAKDPDPQRECTMRGERRQPAAAKKPPGICPDGTPVSPTGTCPAR